MATLVGNVEAHLEDRTLHYQTGLLYDQDKGNFSLITELADGKPMDFEAEKAELAETTLDMSTNSDKFLFLPAT